MAIVTLQVTLTKKNATNAWLVIDNTDDVFANGAGQRDVDGTRANHTYVIWVEGPPGSSCDYEIKQGPDTLVKDTSTVDPGENEQVEHDVFKLI